MRRIAIIAAVAANGVIGHQGGIPWHIPEDLRRFRFRTEGGTVIMGRRTWESLPRRPLAGRQNIVVSRSGSVAPALSAESLQHALKLADSDRVFVIGGTALYQEALPLADDLYITEVHLEVPGDAYFPVWDRGDFEEVSRVLSVGPELNYSLVRYERRT